MVTCIKSDNVLVPSFEKEFFTMKLGDGIATMWDFGEQFQHAVTREFCSSVEVRNVIIKVNGKINLISQLFMLSAMITLLR